MSAALNEDTVRDLMQIRDALEGTRDALASKAQHNAALHCNPTVLYPPLYGKVQLALIKCDKLTDRFSPDGDA